MISPVEGYRFSKLVLKTVVLVLVIVIVVWALIRLLEPRLVFFPSRAWDIELVQEFQPAEEIRFSAEDGVSLSGAWFPAPEPKGVVLYCHGNAGNLSHRIPVADLWRRELEYSVLLFDYRGYGRSEGKPDEEGIQKDARAAFQQALDRAKSLPVVAGRSLGTVSAIRLASERRVRALLLDSPLASAADMAGRILPLPGVRYLISYRLDNLDRIREVSCPVLVLHGERDEIVPLEQGRRVFEAAPGQKEFLLLKGHGHNDDRTDPDILARLKEFLEKLP